MKKKPVHLALGELRNLQDVARENNVKLIFG